MSTPRNRNLLIIIGVLLLTNIAVLVYFLGQKKPATSSRDGKGKSDVAGMLQKEVGFNDEQTAQYKQLKEKHWEMIRPMFDDMRKAKDNLFRLLSYPETSDSLLNKASDAIAQKQKALDMQTFNHFKRVRALCTPDQQPKYDSMVLRMFSRMGKPPHHGETEKKDKKK